MKDSSLYYKNISMKLKNFGYTSRSIPNIHAVIKHKFFVTKHKISAHIQFQLSHFVIRMFILNWASIFQQSTLVRLIFDEHQELLDLKNF